MILSFLNPEKFYEVTIYEQLFRLLLASLLGAVLGMERELKNKPAGFITFMLVSLGSCLISLLQINIIQMTISVSEITKADPGRIIAQVVSGIGFLGAGTIIHNKGNAKGITTAALLWVSAGIGLVVGIGGLNNYIIAIATALLFFPLSLFSRKMGRKFAEAKKVHRILIIFEEEFEREIYDEIAQNGAVVKKTFFHNKFHDNDKSYKEVYFYISMTKKSNYDDLIWKLSDLNFVAKLEET